VDWWSLGVILFEMIVGFPPFFSDSATDTCKKILNWKANLTIPPETKISKDAVDLIRRLITDVDKRLGYNGAEEIKKHPFFKKIDWNNITQVKPDFIPDVF
jgi:serine/threonine protein kinase